jgi:hypothetical protein
VRQPKELTKSQLNAMLAEAAANTAQLRRSARSHRPERSHGAIEMLRQIPILDFPLNKLGVALLFTGHDTTGVERDLIHAYMNSFGDTPPLNYKL